MSLKVTFDFAAQKIVIEGEEGDLLKLAQAAKDIAPILSEISINPQGTVVPSAPMVTSVPVSHTVTTRTPGIREFAKALPLSNNYEKIAALIYHATKIQNNPSVTLKELGEWFGLCGFSKPALMPVAVSDTKRKYDYITSKGRDQWVMSTSGENLILGMLEKQRPA